jgi:hypothetical protein
MSMALLLCVSSASAYDTEFDYNADGVVDDLDIELIVAAFNTMEGTDGFDPAFDHDGDGMVGSTDISIAYAALAAE